MIDNIWRPFTQHKTAIKSIIIKKGSGSTLYDENGKKYIDLISSWWTNIHGHGNKILANQMKKQALKLDHVIFSDFCHDPAIDLVKNLSFITSNNFDKYFFSDNGSTSVEVAIKMMIQYHKNSNNNEKKIIIAFEGGYHGDTFGAMSVGKKSNFFKPFEEMFFEVIHVPFPATWIGDEDVLKRETNTISSLKNILSKYKNQIAGAIFEPLIQGASGMNFVSIDFFNRIVDVLKNENIIIAFDEVMTGFGRTGMFFAYQHLQHTPDIICLSKGITGGTLPIGVTACKNFVFEKFYSDESSKAFLHGHSYTGNPIITSVANENIKLMLQNDSIAKVAKIQTTYQEVIKNTLLKNTNVEKIRTIGSILAFNVKNKEQQYSSSYSLRLKEMFLKKGLVVRPLGNTIYLMPPYCIKKKEIVSSISTILDIVNSF